MIQANNLGEVDEKARIEGDDPEVARHLDSKVTFQAFGRLGATSSEGSQPGGCTLRHRERQVIWAIDHQDALKSLKRYVQFSNLANGSHTRHVI